MPMASRAKSATALADSTKDAYSVNFYSSWRACCTMLLKRGLTMGEAEGVLRSKWTRWAADNASGRYGYATAKDLENFMDNPRNGCTMREIRSMAVEWSPETARQRVGGTLGS